MSSSQRFPWPICLVVLAAMFPVSSQSFLFAHIWHALGNLEFFFFLIQDRILESEAVGGNRKKKLVYGENI